MRVKTRRRGRKLYYGVVHDYRNPTTGRRCQLAILPLGRHATIAAALQATDTRIARLKVLEVNEGLAELARYRAWLRVCQQAGLG
jgi:hypothetical protein